MADTIWLDEFCVSVCKFSCITCDTLMTITLVTKPCKISRHCIQNKKKVNDLHSKPCKQHLPNFTRKTQSLIWIIWWWSKFQTYYIFKANILKLYLFLLWSIVFALMISHLFLLINLENSNKHYEQLCNWKCEIHRTLRADWPDSVST